ncbi:hypothetical protein BpHYR1_049420 [Brachionus plicatilis]|uniref:Uncharacterized protein n=1 Tax=Brachionus plicatilis TaxID=10195 RepID=A0A3M7QJM3_BRAPC|nr:hypothetical protein BpHYR1_049420 [Brachionus plicatilis]
MIIPANKMSAKLCKNFIDEELMINLVLHNQEQLHSFCRHLFLDEAKCQNYSNRIVGVILSCFRIQSNMVNPNSSVSENPYPD